LGYLQFSLEQTVQEVPLFGKSLHQPLQVTTNTQNLQVTTSTQTYPSYLCTQTSPGYNEYTNLSRLYQSQSSPEIKTIQNWNKHSQKREQSKLTRVYFTMVKNYTMVSHNLKIYMLLITNLQ